MRRAYQPVVDSLGNRPSLRVHGFPAALKFGEIGALFDDGGFGPIPRSAGALHAGNIVEGEGPIDGAPGPEIGSQLVERIGLSCAKEMAGNNSRATKIRRIRFASIPLSGQVANLQRVANRSGLRRSAIGAQVVNPAPEAILYLGL